MPSRVRSYVSSNVFGRSFKTFRILAGRVRHRLSTWQTAHRNLQDKVRVQCRAEHKGWGMGKLTYHQLSQTAYRRQVVCPPLSISARLATHKCTFGSSDLTRSSTNSKTSLRADGLPGKFGHSSRASIMI